MKISCLRTEAVHESISHALFNAPSYEIGDICEEKWFGNYPKKSNLVLLKFFYFFGPKDFFGKGK